MLAGKLDLHTIEWPLVEAHVRCMIGAQRDFQNKMLVEISPDLTEAENELRDALHAEQADRQMHRANCRGVSDADGRR